MTDEQFAAGVDAILDAGLMQHASHRALDHLWTRYAEARGGALAEATRKWMASIEGHHRPGDPYPLGKKTWWQRPLECKLGRHEWINNTQPHDWGTVLDCRRCGLHQGYGNPCP